MSTELLEAPQKTESSVMAKYEITKAEIQKAVESASLIVVEGPDDKKGMALARENRLSLQKMRTAIEAKRKDLKADALAYGKKVDAVAKELTAIITPEEQRLRELEETAAREAERLAAIEKEKRDAENKRRCDVLAAIGVMVPVIELSFMDADAFEKFYSEKKAAYDAAKKAEEEAEAARKAEAERLAKAAEEQAVQAAEIARQQAELAKKQAEQQAELDRQKAEIEAKQKAIEEAERAKREKRLGWRTSQLAFVNAEMDQGEMMALTDEEFDEVLKVKTREEAKRKEDAERLATRKDALSAVEYETFDDEDITTMADDMFAKLLASATKSFKMRQEQEARAEAFRKEQEAKAEADRIAELAKDLQETREREAAEEIARKEAEAKAAAEEAARIAALAPDREKIDAYLCEVCDVTVPTLSTDKAVEALGDIIDSFTDSLRELIARLEEGSL